MAEQGTSTWRHLGVVAGGGALPMLLAEQAMEAGKKVNIACLEGFADQDWQGFAVRHFQIEEIASLRDHFLEEGVEAITFAGLVRRPDMDSVAPARLDSVAEKALRDAARRGDDSLLRGVIAYFEEAGLAVIGIADIAPGQVVGEGLAGVCPVPETVRDDCRKSAQIARQIGALDIGQSAVVCDGLVLAVEAQEGTAAMLARCASLPEALRGTPQKRRGVFAKWAKPGQDRRIDLPVVGVDTIEAVAQAGLAGLALEAGAVILLDGQDVIAAADQLGLFILGMEAGD